MENNFFDILSTFTDEEISDEVGKPRKQRLSNKLIITKPTKLIKTKKCKECGVEFPRTSEFFYESNGTLKPTYCKKCTTIRGKKYNVKDDRLSLLRSARKRAKSKNLEFNLTRSDINYSRFLSNTRNTCF